MSHSVETPAYQASWQEQYDLTTTAVGRLVMEGVLGEQYLLGQSKPPALDEQAVDVAQTYASMACQEGWEPAIVFVPRAITLAQWGTLLTGHALPKNKISSGIWRTSVNEVSHNQSEIQPNDVRKNLWNIAIISEAKAPILSPISADGCHGAATTIDSITKLRMRNESDSVQSREEIIINNSPAQAIYYALQWSRLLQGKLPVDQAIDWTLLKERVRINNKSYALFGHWRTDVRQAFVSWIDRDYVRNGLGVRPTVVAPLVL